METKRQIQKITMNADCDEFKIVFAALTGEQDFEGEEEEGEGEGIKVRPRVYSARSGSNDMPHKDFIDAMKKLRKFAFEIAEMTVDSKELPSWTVSEIKISGDYTNKQSRVIMKLAHYVKATKKVIPLGPLPQVTMYPQKDDAVKYHNAGAMTKQIEEVIMEAWLYLNGKFDQKGQLPIFETGPILRKAS